MLLPILITALGGSQPGLGSQCTNGPCAPFNDHCGVPFANAPEYHLMDQHGCGEVINDPVHSGAAPAFRAYRMDQPDTDPFPRMCVPRADTPLRMSHITHLCACGCGWWVRCANESANDPPLHHACASTLSCRRRSARPPLRASARHSRAATCVW